MSPCTAPTFTTVPEPVPACGCAADRESETVPLLLPVLVGVAAFAWVRQRWGHSPVLLHLARPETRGRERRSWRWPRLVLSDRERRALAVILGLFERTPKPALVALRATVSRRATSR